MGKHASDAANLSKGASNPKHSTDNSVDTAAIRVDHDSTGRVTGWGVGRAAGDGNYSR